MRGNWVAQRATFWCPPINSVAPQTTGDTRHNSVQRARYYLRDENEHEKKTEKKKMSDTTENVANVVSVRGGAPGRGLSCHTPRNMRLPATNYTRERGPLVWQESPRPGAPKMKKSSKFQK